MNTSYHNSCLLAVSFGGQYYFPFYDQIGNVLDYADETGAVAAAYEYDAYGNLLDSTGPLAAIFRHRFSTKLLDPDTGLYYYGYRWYSPELGRWISRDPIEEAGGENLYGFCKNSQTQKYDGLGLTIEPSLLVFYPDSAVGMDWEYASLADTIGGETHHEEDVECHQICFPRINKYLPLYGIRCNVAIHQRIFLNKNENRFSLEGTYGHEQRHVEAYIREIRTTVLPILSRVDAFQSNSDSITHNQILHFTTDINMAIERAAFHARNHSYPHPRAGTEYPPLSPRPSKP